MGFENSSCSFTRFRILDQASDELIRQVPELLKKFAFQDIDNLPEIRSFGWVCWDDMLDTSWATSPPQKAGYIAFSLRLDTRRISPAVIKKHVSLALRREKEKLPENGPKFISRERKREIREEVKMNLLTRAFPIPAEFNVIWNLDKNEIWFASIQEKMADLFMELFLNTFELHIEPLNPYNLALAILGESAADSLDLLESASFTGDQS